MREEGRSVGVVSCLVSHNPYSVYTEKLFCHYITPQCIKYKANIHTVSLVFTGVGT